MMARLQRALRAQLLPLVAGFLVLAAIVGGRSLLSETQRQENESVRAVFRFEQRLLGVLSKLQDAETAQRGYLLTGEADYLDPYRSARLSLPADLDALAAHDRENPDRQAKLAELGDVARAKLAEVAETLDLYDAGQAADALALVRSDRGKVLMDRLRQIASEIHADEEAQLQAKLATSERLDDWMRIASYMALAALLAMAVVGYLATRRWFREIAQAQAALAHKNTELSQEIETRRAAEAQVRQMQKMEAIGQLTGGIAHDFNNMLAVIISAMNLAQRKLKRGDADIGAFVEAATDAATRAANLTSRLLAFSRQQPLMPQTIDANRLVSGMSDLLRRALGEAVQIETVLAGGLWRLHADTSQLENALLNLAVNARDAMAEGGKLTIETANCHLDELYSAAHRDVPAGQYVLIAVTDTGAGMPPNVVSRAFDPFFTTKGVNKGTGLGLSQVFGFVKQSGGHVKIYSEPGEGTTVKIYLPRYFGEATEAPASITPDLSAPATETILVVEDDDRVRMSTVATLRELGYVVVHASGAAEALTKLDADPGIALLFTDIIMPATNGKQLAEQARAKRPDLKVLFTTGFTRNAVVHNGVLDPGVDFIAKPFTIDLLARKLREVLDRKT